MLHEFYCIKRTSNNRNGTLVDIINNDTKPSVKVMKIGNTVCEYHWLTINEYNDWFKGKDVFIF